MKKEQFRILTGRKVMVLDGATGTELAKNGMPPGVSPEAWVLENPAVLRDIQQAYADAGSDAVYTCTFGGNRLKLAEFGLENSTAEINTALARISREAVKDRALVLGDIAPTGMFIEPFGELGFEDAVRVYTEQARALLAGGVDGFVIETMMDLQEARAALIAVKETCDLPVMVSMTFGADSRTLNGTDPLSALITLQTLGADAVGCNCSTGPRDMANVIATMKPYANVPLMAKPNAGMPRLIKGETKFDMTAMEFGAHAPLLVEAGAAIVGGCCGTAPKHINAMKKATVSLTVVPPRQKSTAAVCSYRETHLIGADWPMTILGGKINPTGNPDLRDMLQRGDMTLVRKMAQDQAQHGANIIDINVHARGVDEPSCMRSALLAAAKGSGKPVAIDTLNVDAAERALRVFPGRALLNSVSAKAGSMEAMCAVAGRYGAMIVCMPLGKNGAAHTTANAAEQVETILACALNYGVHPEDCLVDCLVFTAAAGPSAHRCTLELVDWCANKRHVASLCGISNLSFGFEERQWIDSTFLCMTAGRGLTAAFIDTASEYTVSTASALDALAGRDHRFARYIGRFGQPSSQKGPPRAHASRSPGEAGFDAVVAGDEDGIERTIKNALDKGELPRSIVDDRLIPAINLVGEKFDRKEYFLPQLITCADTMRKGFEVLQPFLDATEGADSGARPKVLLATVQGDIHDIGKNIVALMLKNYNFDVIDLGKDVCAESVIQAIKKHNAEIVGLSALMTTTMVEMKTIIDLAHREGLKNIRFMIGGAVVDQHYADEINAHGYAGDAIGAVRLAQKFCSATQKETPPEVQCGEC